MQELNQCSRMMDGRINIEIPANEQLGKHGIDAIRITYLDPALVNPIGSVGDFPHEVSEILKLPSLLSAPSIAFTHTRGIGVLTIVLKRSAPIALEAILTKAPIHRQLNLANKFIAALETLLRAIAEGQKDLVFDWSIFEKAQMNLGKASLPSQIDSALNNVLTKKPVLIIGSHYEEVFASLFVLVSPINQPFYKDVNWAINPALLNVKYHYIGYSDPKLATVQEEMNVLRGEEIVRIFIDDNRCEGSFSSPLVRAISEALATGSIETISQTLRAIFAKAKEAKSLGDLQTFKENSHMNPEDAQFLWDLATRVM